MSLLLLSICERALTVHLSIFPLPLIHTAIRPLKDAVAVSLIVYVVALVDAPIGPCVLTSTVHLARMPFAHVFSTI